MKYGKYDSTHKILWNKSHDQLPQDMFIIEIMIT